MTFYLSTPLKAPVSFKQPRNLHGTLCQACLDPTYCSSLSLWPSPSLSWLNANFPLQPDGLCCLCPSAVFFREQLEVHLHSPPPPAEDVGQADFWAPLQATELEPQGGEAQESVCFTKDFFMHTCFDPSGWACGSFETLPFHSFFTTINHDSPLASMK